MQPNLFLKLAINLYEKTVPLSEQKKWTASRGSFSFWQFAGFFLGKILFWNAAVSNAFVKEISRQRSGKFKPISHENLNVFHPVKKFLRAQPEAAVLFLGSHPQPNAEESPILGRMLNHAVRLSEYLRPQRRFKLVQAIDPFALDSLSYPVDALYSGIILSRHIAVHRMPQHPSILEKILWKKMSYHHSIFNWISSLKQGDVVFAALSGGIPFNARIFYTIKEWAHHIYKENFLHKKGISKNNFAFQLAEVLCKQASCACTQGLVSDDEKREVTTILSRYISDGEILNSALMRLEKEMNLETPSRERLFKILISRVCSDGRALVLFPIRHSALGDIIVETPATVFSFSAGVSSVSVQQGEKTSTLSLEQFIEQFVSRLQKN